MSKLILYMTFAISMAGVALAATDKVVCYFGSWATYRPGNGRFDVENIDTNLCTHVIYTFLGIQGDGSIRILDSWNEIDKRALDRFASLKNANTKVIIAIGGFNEGSINFSKVAASPSLRATFIKNVVAFLDKYKYDGFDLDWEYPAQRGGSPADKANFATLVREMKDAFNKKSPPYLLTTAVLATKDGIQTSYDVPNLVKYLDWINIMTYDLHGPWDLATGHHSPMYASSIDTTAFQKQLNIDSCVKAWIAAGAPNNKLVLGVATYGKTFTLTTSNAALGAPTTSSGGNPGPYTGQQGMVGYNEICELRKQISWKDYWINEQQVPYAVYKGNQWIGYDDDASVAIKAQYAVAKGLAGVMIWSIETDDFRGMCGGPKFPLLTAINNVLFGNYIPPPTSSTTTPKPSVGTVKPTNPPTSSGVCTEQGYFRELGDCSKFYCCIPSGSGFRKADFSCPSGLVFDEKLKACNYPDLVTC